MKSENDLENMLEECKKSVSDGGSREDLILHLHREGFTIVESMKILKEVYKLSLGEAKELVTSHSVWADEVRSADILHEELEKALQGEDANPSVK